MDRDGHVTMEAETGVTASQGPQTDVGTWDSFPREHGPADTSIPASAFQNHERKYSCFKYPVCGTPFRKPQETMQTSEKGT